MTNPNLMILYVNNPLASADFYATLLQKPPVESSPTFVMFALQSDMMLGLWAKHTVEPAATVTGGGAEIAFSLPSREAVNERFAVWSQQGLSMAQIPTEMDFGYTFVAQDLDGHRLRVFCAA